MKSSLVKSTLVLASLSATAVAHARSESVADVRVRCMIASENLVTHQKQTREVEVTLEDMGSTEAGAGKVLAEVEGTALRVSSPLTVVRPVLNLEVSNPSSKAIITRELNANGNLLIYRVTQGMTTLDVGCDADVVVRH